MQQAVFTNVERSWPQWQVAYSNLSEDPISASDLSKYTVDNLKVERGVVACERLTAVFLRSASAVDQIHLSYPIVPDELLNPGESSDIRDDNVEVMDESIAKIEHLGERFVAMNSSLETYLVQLSAAALKNRSSRVRVLSEQIHVFQSSMKLTVVAYREFILTSKALSARVHHDKSHDTKTVDGLSELKELLHGAWEQ